MVMAKDRGISPAKVRRAQRQRMLVQPLRGVYLRSDVELTTGDFDILWLLASRQGSVVTRDEILRVVRGIDYDGLDRSIDARICRLRRKLQEAGGAESMIKTVRLRGYLFAGEG